MQDPLSRTQRERLCPSHSNARHGGPQVGRIFAYEETLRVQVRALVRSHFSCVKADMASSGVPDTRRTSRRGRPLGTPILRLVFLRAENNVTFVFFFLPYVAVLRSPV